MGNKSLSVSCTVYTDTNIYHIKVGILVKLEGYMEIIFHKHVKKVQVKKQMEQKVRELS